MQINSKYMIGPSVSGQLQRCDEPISFWGGFDFETGRINDLNSPIHDLLLSDRIVFVSALKGSTAAPGALLEWFNASSRPRAIITQCFEPAIAISVNLFNAVTELQITYAVAELDTIQSDTEIELNV